MPYSMQLTELIPNDPPRMGAKSTTTSNHPSTPRTERIKIFVMAVDQMKRKELTKLFIILVSMVCSPIFQRCKGY